METLLHLYSSLDKKLWDYYDGINEDYSVMNPFSNNVNTANNYHFFIEQYFGMSGKRMVLKDMEGKLIFSDNLATHTSSVFFFGLLLRENTVLKQTLFNDKRSKLNYPIFPFLWFLSILFHDYAKTMEDDSTGYLANIKTVDDLKTEFDIKHFLLDNIPTNIHEQLQTLIPDYFLYRLNDKKIDHGIFAGCYIYDRLVKIRRKKYRKDKELHWPPSLEKKYALAATAIACHNIWTTSKGSKYENSYHTFKLENLIIPAFDQVSINNFPLLFLFGIVDTIDPIKLYSKLDHLPEEILSSLEITFTPQSFTIKNGVDSKLNFNVLRDASKNFRGWLAVEILIDTPNLLTIKFKT